VLRTDVGDTLATKKMQPEPDHELSASIYSFVSLRCQSSGIAFVRQVSFGSFSGRLDVKSEHFLKC
jgi:hypothetical protein